MVRGNGFRPHNTAEVNGTPLQFVKPTTEALAFGQIVYQGSTYGGAVGKAATTNVEKPKFIAFKATTGAQDLIPVLRLGTGSYYELIAPAASSGTVVSTTNIGNYIAFSSSGTALVPATTGHFVVSGVFNTSSVTAQFFTGYFVTQVATTA